MMHISLFSGGGGFDLAAEWVGWQNILSCETGDFQNTILQYYWPNVRHHRDIKTLTGDIIRNEAKKYRETEPTGKIVLSGGFPCQPFSQAGQRKGAADNRYLWPEMFRIIEKVRPDWVVAENVAGFLSMVFPGESTDMESEGGTFREGNNIYELRQQYIFSKIVDDLEKIGYDVQAFVIPACAVGAPHRRDRVWIVANARSTKFQDRASTCNRQDKTQDRAKVDDRIKRFSHIESFTNPLNTGLQGNERCREDEKKDKERGESTYRSTSEFHRRSDWENWPTQPPVCSGNDGFPGRLDGITFSKWRQESIKLMGNAIVPQVAYKIFKGIDEIENSK